MERLKRKPPVPLFSLFVFTAAGLLVQPPASISVRIPVALPTLMSDTTIAVQTPVSPVKAGDEFDISVTMTTDVPTWGVQFQLTYDPTLLEITGVDEGGFYNEWAAANGASGLSMPKPAADNTKGIIPTTAFFLIGAAPGMGPTGSGTLAVLHARALKNGMVELKLSEIEVISSGLIDGTTAKLSGVKTRNGIISIGGDAVAQPTPVGPQATATVTVYPTPGPVAAEPTISTHLLPTPTSDPGGVTGILVTNTLIPAANSTPQPDPDTRVGFNLVQQVINTTNMAMLILGLFALMLAFGLGYSLGKKNRPVPVKNTGSSDAGEKSTEVIDRIETDHQSSQGDNEIK